MDILRIIPALAGNTRSWYAQLLDPGDHPRSRGEYGAWARYHTGTDGSSPLSRGIQPRALLRQRPGRIIPALAGNTMSLPMPLPWVPDHPRSRGEYNLIVLSPQIAQGSSPLSRGILRERCCRVQLSRIIPALAGNTLSHSPTRMRTRDHPRSRGEYYHHGADGGQLFGSSPLSRGIPPTARWWATRPGIIPALAGNTLRQSPRRRIRRDHPRSRGEYNILRDPLIRNEGSSPLSRGIPGASVGC